MTDSSEPVLLFIHGMWHGSWTWEELFPHLHRHGLRAVAMDLPGKRRAPGDRTFAGHWNAVRDKILELNRPVIVCSHSYGGAVVTQATSDLSDHVLSQIYIAAFMLEEGETCESVNDSIPGSSASTDDITLKDGYLTLDPSRAFDALYHDCSEEIAHKAISRLTPEYYGNRIATVRNPGWRDSDTSYVIASEDRGLLPEIQETMSKRATRVRTIPTSHSPMLSAPASLAELLAEFVAEARTARG